MNLSESRVIVLGMGVTGVAATTALRAAGATVVTVDKKQSADHADLVGLDLTGFDLAVASPGWSPLEAPLLAVASAGIDIWSEVELAWRLRDPSVPWVLVTGTNGKTTTVQMVGAIARAAGLRYAVVGNVGAPVVAASAEPGDLLIVEMSSYQLHYTHSVAPLAAVCLNADADHLDWHGSAEAYQADKARVYERTRIACLYPVDAPHIRAMVENADVEEGCRAIGLTLGVPSVSQLGVIDDLLVDRAFLDNRQREAVSLATIGDMEHLTAGTVPPYLVGNALAAAGLARAAGISPHHVAQGLRESHLDHHRTAHVATIDGVLYVDDSKGTNAHATRAAFGGISEGTAVWIAGGLTKGVDMGPLVRDVAQRLRAAVIIGVDPTPFVEAFGRHAPGIPVAVVPPGETVMQRAVEAARGYARPGDTVLLSPACASMDQFRDYADRGGSFAQAVGVLTE